MNTYSWHCRIGLPALIGLSAIIGCGPNPQEVHDAQVIQEGKVLAAHYCQSCHLLPDPALLDKKTWLYGVMPNMGPRLGIFRYNGKDYPVSRFHAGISRDFYPDKPLLTDAEWGRIIAYYTATAPDSLPDTKDAHTISLSQHLFHPEKPAEQYDNPVSTYVGIDTINKQIIQAEGQRRELYTYSEQLRTVDSVPTSSMVVDMVRKKNEKILCNIGVINPNDGRFGMIQSLVIGKKNQRPVNKLLIDSLRRPVELLEADLNGDQKPDYLICEFGNLVGALSWYENKGRDHFERHVLRESPGAIHAIIRDDQHNGLPDIWVLFAQGDEAIIRFHNKGAGQFEQETIMRFPSVYGSTYFELDDFNGDGHADILYSAGDNADFSQILKPYHGVYIYLNDGQDHFKQTYFFPLHGCFKVMAADFDHDGDLDIAAISFFADYVRDPQEGFVYLENKGHWQFNAFSLPETRLGRWITMDVGDLDHNGLPDIVIGNFSVGPTKLISQDNWKKGPPFLFLRNMGGK